jgi:hypothetical protein
VRARLTSSPALLVTIAATVYSWVLTFPLILHLNSAIYGYPGDSTGGISIYDWWGYALRHHLDLFNNTLWGAPYGAGWQAVPFAVLPVLILGPLAAVAGGTVAYNLQMLSAFPLTAWLTFLASRRLGTSRVGAAFAALAFTFIPYHLEKAQGHVAETHMETFSGILYFLLRWRQGGSRWNLVAAGAFAGLAVWNDYYMAYIAAFLVATWFAVALFDRRTVSEPRRWIPRNVAGGLLIAVTTALFVPAALLFADRPGSGGSFAASVKAQVGALNEGIDQVTIFSARREDYYLPYYANPLTPASIVSYERAHLHFSNFVEQTLFLGYTVMLLALVGLAVGFRRFETWLLVAIAAVGFVVGEPPLLHRFGPLEIPSPSLVLTPLVPIFRVYARFAMLVMLAVTLLAGLGMTWLQGRLRGRAALLLAAPFLLTAIEFNNVPPLHVTTLFPAPTEYQWLSHQPPGILVEYPLKAGTDLSRQQIEDHLYTLYQPVHGHPLFNGGTSLSKADQLSPGLEPYYGPGVADELLSIGVRYVFVHRATYLQDGLEVTHDVPGMTYVDSLDGVDIFTIG